MRAVLDSNVFIHGRGGFEYDKVFTVEGVVEEVRSEEGRNVMQNTDFELEEPSAESLEKVGRISEEVNSPTSEVDEKLVALALENNCVVISDDRAVQNLAWHSGADFEAFLDEEIDGKRVWERKCENCGLESGKDSCPRCGSGNFNLKEVRYSSV